MFHDSQQFFPSNLQIARPHLFFSVDQSVAKLSILFYCFRSYWEPYLSVHKTSGKSPLSLFDLFVGQWSFLWCKWHIDNRSIVSYQSKKLLGTASNPNRQNIATCKCNYKIILKKILIFLAEDHDVKTKTRLRSSNE